MRSSIALCCLPATMLLTASVSAASAEDLIQETGVRGGLIVHIGSGDGKRTVTFHANEGCLVYGLDKDAENVRRARAYAHTLGLDGKVTFDTWNGERLPFADNFVNLLVSERPLGIPRDEVLRVLAPGGVLYLKKAGQWTKFVRPRPDSIDEWTHYLHDASGNAVAEDLGVGPPQHIQWMAEPTWSRYHHTLASMSALVSAKGRLFYIIDESPAAAISTPSQWFVVARDAFSGVLLWQRPIPAWAYHLRKFRSGPVQLPRTLVAEGNRVYVTLGIDAPVSALDAATGEIVRTYDDTADTEEIVLHEGVLFVVTGSPVPEQAAVDPTRSDQVHFPNDKSIVAVQADTGRQLWQWSEPDSGAPIPLTLAASENRVCFATKDGVRCLNSNTGEEVWRSASAGSRKPNDKATSKRKKPGRKPNAKLERSVGWASQTLVIHEGIVFWANGRTLFALSAETGEPLWNCECKAGFKSPADLLVIDGLVWIGPDFSEGRDVHTGETKRSGAVLQQLRTVGHHHRCYREKATDRYILSGYRGIEFFDLLGENHSRNNWVRGVCQYGILPCNGLVYAPMHACGCFMESKLRGFWALAPGKASSVQSHESRVEERLERGPAFGQTRESGSPTLDTSVTWHTYRHDPLRSGSTPNVIPVKLAKAWQTSIGSSPLSAPVVANGLLVVSSVDAHRVVALDATTGAIRWEFSTGGRVDSPPTFFKNRLLFGSADGYVYCLRASDGQLVWRFLAAATDTKTIVRNQIESVWPVHGSVLIEHGVAYVAAGRSSYLDHGICLYGLDPATGNIVSKSRVCSEHPDLSKAPATDTDANKIGQNATDYKTFTAPDRSDAFSMSGATSDVLVSDSSSIYLRQLRFNRECEQQETQGRHLFSTSSLLDDAENHRSHWVLGVGDFSRIPVAYSWIANNASGRNGIHLAVPYGLMLSFDDQTVWGIRRDLRHEQCMLFGERNRPFSAAEAAQPDFRPIGEHRPPHWTWSAPLPIHPHALLRSGGQLLVGGLPAATEQTDLVALYAGQRGGVLWVASNSDGKQLAEYPLDSPPVWDGMAVAGRHLYLSTTNGTVVCLGEPTDNTPATQTIQSR